MKFTIRFRIGKRFGKGSRYSLREVCIHLVEQYSLTETEIRTVVTLGVGCVFSNEDMHVKRVA